MGTHVEGSIWVRFSRELSPGEYADWSKRCVDGRPDLGACANRDHEGALLDPETGSCEHFQERLMSLDGKTQLRAASVCYSDSERFDPDGWDFTGETWGDVGVAELMDDGFTINSSGKVYDVADACAWFVEALPDDVTARGFGRFESDSEPWGLLVNERTVITSDVYDVSGPVYAGLVKLAAHRPSSTVLNRETWALLSTVLDLFSIENPDAIAFELKEEGER